MGKKRPKNLLLDDEALRRAEGYCAGRGTTLSRLVEDYLMALAEPRSPEIKSPIVRRLLGAASRDPVEPDAYRDYLRRTYEASERRSH
jgi:hypothetical protein